MNCTIELAYYDSCGEFKHFFFPDVESNLARSYLEDAMRCRCKILIWRLVPHDRIRVI